MTALKSLTFTTLPTQSANPILDRRAKVIARLEEQKLILKDPNYTRTNRKWVKKDGERVMVDVPAASRSALISQSRDFPDIFAIACQRAPSDQIACYLRGLSGHAASRAAAVQSWVGGRWHPSSPQGVPCWGTAHLASYQSSRPAT